MTRGALVGRALFLALGFLLGAAAWAPVRRASGAATVLVDLGDPAAAKRARAAVRTVPWTVPGDPVPAKGRLYLPPGPVRRCVVIGHGVHHLGIDEPRLGAFASELAMAGVLVGTPELRDLADYRITARGARTLASAVRALSARCAGGRVGLLGFSFAGGLSLLAAEDPEVAARLEYVASVGGYHDLRRVLRFLLDGRVEAPAAVSHREPHEYGGVVLLYGYLERFVPVEELPLATAAVQAWLEEDRARAWALASLADAAATERVFGLVAAGKVRELSPELARILAEHDGELAELSPAGHLASIPVPVYLLHGHGDSVIPPEETLWAERELEGRPHRALVSPLIEHVEVSGHPKWQDQLDLVRFMSELL